MINTENYLTDFIRQIAQLGLDKYNIMDKLDQDEEWAKEQIEFYTDETNMVIDSKHRTRIIKKYSDILKQIEILKQQIK